MMREFLKFNRQAFKPDRECKRGGGHHKRFSHFMSSQQSCSNPGAQGEPSAPSYSRSFFEQGLPVNVEGIIESVSKYSCVLYLCFGSLNFMRPIKFCLFFLIIF